MSDAEEPNIDLTRSPPAAPLPAPTTTSTRSLRPRRQRGRASATSSAVSSSRSRSRSAARNLQLLYPEGPGSPEGSADPGPSSSGHVASRSEEASSFAGSSRTNGGVVSNHVAEGEHGEGSSSGRTKRRRSPSPAPGSSSGGGGRRGKRRALRVTDVPPDDAVGTNEGSSSTHVSSEAGIWVGNSGTLSSVSQEPSVAEPPAAWGPQNASMSQPVPGDPLEAYERMMDEHSSTPRAHGDDNASDPPFLDDFALPSLPGPPALLPTPDRGPTPPSPNTERSETEATPTAQVEPERPPDTVPIDEVEPLAAYTCPICFSPPSHATITPCGHLLCGECLFTAVKTTIQRGAYTLPPGERMIARCPVCRAPIAGWDGKGGGVIGLRPRAVFSL